MTTNSYGYTFDNEPFEITVAELTAKYAPPSDSEERENWADVTATFLSEPSEAAIVEQLRAELAANGRYELPVNLDSDVMEVKNGRHRVVAAILEGVESITVVEDLPHGGLPEFEVTFTIDATDAGEAMDEVFGWIGTLRTGDLWLNGSALTWNGEAFNIVYAFLPERTDEVTAALKQTIAEHTPFTATIVSITPWDADAE